MMQLFLALLLTASAATCSDAALVEPYAGGGIGDGLFALDAPLQPMGVAVDGDGNVFVSDNGSARVRRIDAATGLISTVVGSEPGWCGYGGPGTGVCVVQPRGLSVDGGGNVYVTDAYGVVQRWDAASGQVTHVAGRSLFDPDGQCTIGSGLPATDTCMSEPTDVVRDDATGEVYVLGEAGRRVFRIDGGVATFYAGCGATNDTVSGEGGPATAACLGHAEGIDLDAAGNLFIATLFDSGRVSRVDATSGILTRIAGGGDGPTCSAGDIPATDACFVPRDVTVGAGGDLFTIGFQGAGIRRVDAATQQISRVTPGPGEWQIDAAPDGFLYTAGASQVFRVDPAGGNATPVAGNGWTSFCGEGVPATDACLSSVYDVAATSDGTLYLVDPYDADRIRRVDATTGIITTVANGGVCRQGASVDPDVVCFNERVSLAATPGGALYVVDTHGNDDEGFRQLVRRLDPATGALTTVAGRCQDAAPGGIPAIDACLDAHDIAADAAGNLYLAERRRVRRIDAVTGEISVVAGNGTRCEAGYDPVGPALSVCLEPERVTVAPDGTLYIVSSGPFRNDVVLRYDAATATLAQVAGRTDATCSRVPDGARATAGCLEVDSLLVDGDGNLFIGSRGVVRLVEAASHRVTTLAGREPNPDGSDPCCEGCANPPACLRATDLAFDAEGRVLTAEPEKRQVRRLTLTCGDGVVGEGEVCDDGNLVSADGCDADCTPSRCGHSLAPVECVGQPVPRAITRAFDRSCVLEARFADVETPRSVRNLERSLARTFRTGLRQVTRAERRGLIGKSCADTLAGAFD